MRDGDLFVVLAIVISVCVKSHRVCVEIRIKVQKHLDPQESSRLRQAQTRLPIVAKKHMTQRDVDWSWKEEEEAY